MIVNKFSSKYLRQDKVNLIMSLYVKNQSIVSTSNTIFWWALQTQTEWVIFELARTHHLGLKVRNFENPIFIFGSFSLKAVYNSCKLQRFCKLQSFFYILLYSREHNYSFQAPIYWNFHHHKRLLLDEVFQWW